MEAHEVPSDELRVEVVGDDDTHFEATIKNLFENDAVIEYDNKPKPAICLSLTRIKFPPEKEPFNVFNGMIAEVLVLLPGHRGWYKCSVIEVKSTYAKIVYLLMNKEIVELVNVSRLRAFNLEPLLSERHQYKLTVLLPQFTREYAFDYPDIHEDFRRLIGNAYVNYSSGNDITVVRSYEKECIRRAIVLSDSYIEGLIRKRTELTIDDEVKRRLIVAMDKGFTLTFDIPEHLKEATLGANKRKLREVNKMEGISYILCVKTRIFIHGLNVEVTHEAKSRLEQFQETLHLPEYTFVELVQSNLKLMIEENLVDVTIPGITESFPNLIPEMKGVVPITVTGTRTNVDRAMTFLKFQLNNIERGIFFMRRVNLTGDDTDGSVQLVSSDEDTISPPSDVEEIIVDETGDGADLAIRYVENVVIDEQGDRPRPRRNDE